jgi:hypothetical protein
VHDSAFAVGSDDSKRRSGTIDPARTTRGKTKWKGSEKQDETRRKADAHNMMTFECLELVGKKITMQIEMKEGDKSSLLPVVLRSRVRTERKGDNHLTPKLSYICAPEKDPQPFLWMVDSCGSQRIALQP